MSLPSTELELLESLSEAGRPGAESAAWRPICADLPPVPGLGEWGPAPRRAVGARAEPGAPRPWWQRLWQRARQSGSR